MVSAAILGSLLLGLVHLVAGDCLDGNVVTAPVRNTSFNGVGSRRGLMLSVGTEPQQLAFDVAGFANNTFLWDDRHGCRSLKYYDAACRLARGGIFNTSKSTTWANGTAQNLSATDTPTTAFNFTPVSLQQQGTDILHVNSSFSLYDFPFDSTHQNINLNSLGLGPNSTFLQYLVDTGAILSKTWSYYYGQYGIQRENQVNGETVFGGMDKAKTQGDNQTFSVVHEVPNCRTGLMARLSRIDVGFDNGTEQNAFAYQANVCLDPTSPLMTFSSDTIAKLKSKFGGTLYNQTSTGLAAGGLLYHVDDAFTGNLSLTFNNQLKITIPNHQLVVMDEYISKNDQIEGSDTSREILVGTASDVGTSNMWYLGAPFFSSAYMMVNQDLGKFSIWANNVTSTTDYRPIDSSGTVCPSADSGSDDNLSGGAIAGIVVGVVAFVAIVAALAGFFFWRRRRAQKISGGGAAAGAAAVSNPPAYGYGEAPQAPSDEKFAPKPPVEVAGDAQRVAEAPGDAHDTTTELPAGANQHGQHQEQGHHVFELPAMEHSR